MSRLGGRLRFASFVGVGGIGFAVDAAVLSALVHGAGWVHYAARAVSFAAAVTVTWLGNRYWVFERTRDVRREYGAYFGTQILGAAVNLGTYSLVIASIPELAAVPVIPLAVGAALAALFNYAAASRWVFTR